MQREKWTLNSNDWIINYSIFKNNNKWWIVIFCHWLWTDSNGKTFDLIANYLAEKWYSSIKFDFFWHWESSWCFQEVTPQQSEKCLTYIYDFIKDQWYDTIWLFGTSYWGLIASIFAAKNVIDFLVLKSPLSDYASKEIQIYWKAHIKAWKKQWYCIKNIWKKEKLWYLFLKSISSKQFILYWFGNQISCPVLIIHWSSDELVPVQQSIQLNSKINDSRLIILSWANHTYSNIKHFDELIFHIKTFVDFLQKA